MVLYGLQNLMQNKKNIGLINHKLLICTETYAEKNAKEVHQIGKKTFVDTYDDLGTGM
jgi:hypothetical protein